MAGIDDLIKSLDSLKLQTLPIEKANEVIVVIGSHVTKETQLRLHAQYSWLKLHKTKGELEYTQAKMAGAKVATGDIVVYADSDVRYQKSWLKNLLDVFVKYPDATVAAGETQMRIHSAYTLSLALCWMLNIWPTSPKTSKTNVFALNNFAIKRKVMLENPFPILTLYRGKITFWRKRLIDKGYIFYRTPGAMGHHAPPSNLIDWWHRMIIYGADFVATADFTLNPDGTIKESRFLSKRGLHLLLWIGMKIKQLVLHSIRIVKQEPQNMRFFIMGIPLSFITIGVTLLGGIVTLFNRDYCYKKITALESSHAA